MLESLLILALAGATAPATNPGPPLDLTRPPVHDVTMTVEVGPARDVLALITGGADAPAALRRLRASRAVSVALSRAGGNPEDVFGRLVSVAAGSPDPLLSGYAKRAPAFTKLLDALEADGTTLAMLQARRVAALLPSSPRVTARLRVVPLFALSGFDDVVVEEDGETTWLFADLPRLLPEGGTDFVPREVILGLLRSAGQASYEKLFRPFRSSPTWNEAPSAGFDALLARTVAEGPATMFLFADEFYPLGTMFEEPIGRSFGKWNEAAEALLDPKATEEAKRKALAAVDGPGDFWSRHVAVVGAKVTETILLRAGNARFLEALAAGPRAVASLYLEVTRKAKEPAFGKAARKALEAKGAGG